MKILTHWLRSYLPVLDVDDAQLAEDLTLRGIAVEGVEELSDLAGDSEGALFEMDITTNRVDAMNHYGVAREAAAIYDVPLHALKAELPAPEAGEPFPVRIEDEAGCGRFTAQVIRGVSIGPSAGAVAHYFGELGQRPILNAVDATNFVLLAMGQPSHAYDLDKLTGGLTVRRARAGEQVKLLDGVTRTLTADDLVVADERAAQGLAGVMGGWESMITAETRNVLVECAWFDPATVRASSRRHGLHTDASHRYERGADFAAPPVANALVCREILAACGGRLRGAMTDVVVHAQAASTADRGPVELSVARTQRLLGKTLAAEGITPALIERFLTALGCRLHATSPDLYEVTLPSWRLDLAREIDLVEEIARVYGFNGFANTLPTPGTVQAHPRTTAEIAVRRRLFALGFSEALSSTFASAADAVAFAAERPAVPLENPLSEEAACLRPTLLPAMAEMLAHNLNRDVLSARLFEIGARFYGRDPQCPTDAVVEEASLALGLTGAATATPLHAATDAPFFELKGALGAVLALFDTPAPECVAIATAQPFEPGRAAEMRVGGRQMARFGQLATAEAARRKLRQPVYLAELDLESLLRLPLRHPLAGELSRYQAVERDFSFLIAATTPWQAVEDAIHTLSLPELQSLRAVEIFRDAARLPGQASLLLRTVFQAQDRTLAEAELTAWSAAVVGAVEALGGKLRG